MIPIRNGPGVWDLILAFFDISPLNDIGELRTVSFQTEDGEEIEVQIVTLKRERWFFSTKTFSFVALVKESNATGVSPSKYLSGVYSTQTRAGRIDQVYGSTREVPAI